MLNNDVKVEMIFRKGKFNNYFKEKVLYYWSKIGVSGCRKSGE